MFDAKFAPIASPSVLGRFLQTGVLQGYSFFLVHEVHQNPRGYRELVEEMVKVHGRVRIIVDNGVIERGEPWGVDEIITTVKSIENGAARFYIPHRDWLTEAEPTCIAAKEDIPKIVEAGYRPLLIPQGKDFDEVELSTLRISTIGISHMWGIPRWMGNAFGSRKPVVEMISKYYDMSEIHLLGFSDHFYDDMACCHLPGVVGIDSAMPVWYEHDLRIGPPPPEMKRPEGFFTWMGAPFPGSRNCRYVWQLISGGSFARHYDNDGEGYGSASPSHQSVG